MSIQTIYVEKRPGQDLEAQALHQELQEHLGITGLHSLRLVQRYQTQGLEMKDLERAIPTVLSQPGVEEASQQLNLQAGENAIALALLPGQFDQRADAVSQSIQLQTAGERPLVSCARVYILGGQLDEGDIAAIKGYLINPVEAQEIDLDAPALPQEAEQDGWQVPVLEGFRALRGAALADFIAKHSLAMEADDLQVCIEHFEEEGRDPTETELLVLDTYWSDHCRHTTFHTKLREIRFQDALHESTYQDYLQQRQRLGIKRPVSLMDLATIGSKVLKAAGRLPELDESEEVNACTLRLAVDTQQGKEDWLFHFKNETHNHPTEIEPFGGASTCLGGAIRDPLSARAHVYAGMRVTGAADPRQPIADTLPGKLPQRGLCRTAAAGFASYCKQIGAATGLVSEIYHPGYVAKRMECGAVLGAGRAEDVRREVPQPQDLVILVGGRTGRDGIGGASGSSVAHTKSSSTQAAAQVQKGNAPEERKLQRLFLNPIATRLIKRCNDFGAGGVSVAIGELADGLNIRLDAVPVKYPGLNGSELAIAESQERMAVVVAREDAAAFIQYADAESLEATVVAEVTDAPRLVMHYKGQTLVDLPRAFLNKNGASKQMDVQVNRASYHPEKQADGFVKSLKALVSDLNGCSQEGLIQRFDHSAGANSLLLPLGGRQRKTPPQAMAHLLPVPGGSSSASFMAYGFDPFISSQSPYHGAYLAVVQSVARLLATGAPFEKIYLSFQEFFPRLGKDENRWGQPLAALLGAFRAQMDLGCAAIGGKDSMSGSFEGLDVPPTLISFAVTVADQARLLSPEIKQAGSTLRWLRPELGPDGLPTRDSLQSTFENLDALVAQGQVRACFSPGFGGALYALYQMAIGNNLGVRLADDVSLDDLLRDSIGSFIIEVDEDCRAGTLLGKTQAEALLHHGDESIGLEELNRLSSACLEGVYPSQVQEFSAYVPTISSHHQAVKGPSFAKPRVVIPAYPGSNGELDSQRAFEKAGCQTQLLVIRNRNPRELRDSIQALAEAIERAQILFLPSGYSGGAEVENSAQLISALLGNPRVKEAVDVLLHKHLGLIGGIDSGFSALLQLGLLPSGSFETPSPNSPTLGLNSILRHQSGLVKVRLSSTLSPWFSAYQPGEAYSLPVSSSEGRLILSEGQLESLAKSGQVATQYVDEGGQASMDIRHNPFGSSYAIEALTSTDGRVMGRMGHSERMLEGLYRNAATTGEDPLFRSAAAYFK